MNFPPVSRDQTLSPGDGEWGNGLILGRLLRDLGPPPPDVAERWVSAAQAMLGDQFRDGQPLPPVQFDALELTSAGAMRPVAVGETAPPNSPNPDSNSNHQDLGDQCSGDQGSGERDLGDQYLGDPIADSRVWMNEFCRQLGFEPGAKFDGAPNRAASLANPVPSSEETFTEEPLVGSDDDPDESPDGWAAPDGSTHREIATTAEIPSTAEISDRRGKKYLGFAAAAMAVAGLLAIVWLVGRDGLGSVAQSNPDAQAKPGAQANPDAQAVNADQPTVETPRTGGQSPASADSPIPSDDDPPQRQAVDLAEPPWAIEQAASEMIPGPDEDLAADLLADPVALPEMGFGDVNSSDAGFADGASAPIGAADHSDDPTAADAPADLTNPLLTGAFESPDSDAGDRPTIAAMAPAQLPGEMQTQDAAGAPAATLAEVLEGAADDDRPKTANGDDPSDDQPTRKLSVAADDLPSAVSLASDDLAENGHRLWTLTTPIPLAVELPGDEVSLSIRGDHPEWQVLGREDQPVATIDARPDGAYFRWADDRGRTRDAMALRRARLRLGDRVVYLRLPVGAEPFRFRFDDIDQKPAWNLDAPIAMAASEMMLDWDLPESVDIAWIEPIEPDTFRGGRAIATLSPPGDESYALGIRMDFRCGRKLSCRLRYAARLDPTMPWQPISHPRLDQAAVELTQYADAIEREKQRLARVDDIAYDLAGRQGKRIIAEKTARNDARGQWVRTSLQRVNQLQGMLRNLENESELRIQLRTRWNDGVQTILSVGTEGG